MPSVKTKKLGPIQLSQLNPYGYVFSGPVLVYHDLSYVEGFRKGGEVNVIEGELRDKSVYIVSGREKVIEEINRIKTQISDEEAIELARVAKEELGIVCAADYKAEKSHWQPLFEAKRESPFDLARQFVESGWSSLMISAYEGNLEELRQVLAKGADINCSSSKPCTLKGKVFSAGSTALSIAEAVGDQRVVALLKSYTEQPQQAFKPGMSGP